MEIKKINKNKFEMIAERTTVIDRTELKKETQRLRDEYDNVFLKSGLQKIMDKINKNEAILAEISRVNKKK